MPIWSLCNTYPQLVTFIFAEFAVELCFTRAWLYAGVSLRGRFKHNNSFFKVCVFTEKGATKYLN